MYEHGGIVAECVGIVGVEVGRVGATAFISEEMVLGCELSAVFPSSAISSRRFATISEIQALRLDKRNLHVAVAVPVKAEL